MENYLKSSLWTTFLCIALIQPHVFSAVPDLTERRLMDPTAWYWLTNVPVEKIAEKAGQGFRVFDLEVDDASPLRMSAVMVKNEGVHQKGWWWYHGLTAEQVKQKIDLHKARIIDLEVYRVNNEFRYAMALVSNTGNSAKDWWFYTRLKADEINEKLDAHKARLIDLDTYEVNGERYFSVAMIANTGEDKNGWWYYTNLTTAEISEKLSQNKARLTSIEVRGQGNSGPVFSVIMEKTDGETWWWYYGKTLSEVKQIYGQKGARIIDLEPYKSNGQQLYAVLLLRNTDDFTEKMRGYIGDRVNGGVYGFYVKKVNGAVETSLLADQVFYPASTIKVLEHLYAMCAVQDGKADLQTTKIKVYPDPNQSCANSHSGHTSVSQTLEKVLSDMMIPSDNEATNAIQEYFGNGNAATGRTAMNKMAHDVLKMSKQSALNHKLGCGGPDNDPPNALTLEDLGRLYEKVANGLFTKKQAETDFYRIMAHGVGEINGIVDAEGAKLQLNATVIQSFKSKIKTAAKAGSVDPNGKNWKSVGGWVSLPVKNGPSREYVFGLFVEAADSLHPDYDTWKCRAELLRDVIRGALKTYK